MTPGARLKKELRDQSAHLIAGITILGLAATNHVLGWAAAGFCLGFIRELTEEGPPVTLGKARDALVKSKLDLTFWTISGVVSFYFYA